jgi:hypothetical protein
MEDKEKIMKKMNEISKASRENRIALMNISSYLGTIIKNVGDAAKTFAHTEKVSAVLETLKQMNDKIGFIESDLFFGYTYEIEYQISCLRFDDKNEEASGEKDD